MKETPARAPGKRPDHVKAPAHLTKSPPVPAPDPIDADISDNDGPARYGDWEHKGIAVDF